jgi:hypothetical protein
MRGPENSMARMNNGRRVQVRTGRFESCLKSGCDRPTTTAKDAAGSSPDLVAAPLLRDPLGQTGKIPGRSPNGPRRVQAW